MCEIQKPVWLIRNAVKSSRKGSCASARKARPREEVRKPGARSPGTPIATGSAGSSAALPGLAPRLSSTGESTMARDPARGRRAQRSGAVYGIREGVALRYRRAAARRRSVMIDLRREGDVFVLRMDAGENRF